ncbi:MAG: SecDF P1 head subdomain-containing protein [Planctomycetota bacterium]|jgi:hypothetical protein
MGKSLLFAPLFLLLFGGFAQRAEAGEPKEKKVWMDFYRLCLKAEQQGQRAPVTDCRDQAATENGYTGWADFVAKAKAALAPADWIRIQREAHAWYKKQPGAGGPRREAGIPAEPRRGGPGVEARPPKDWKELVRAEFVLQLGALPPPPELAKVGDPLKRAVEVMKARLEALSLEGFEVESRPGVMIAVRLPPMDEENLAGVKALILMRGVFRFRLVAPEALAAAHRGKKPPPNHEWLDYIDKEKRGVESELVMIDDGANFGAETIKTAYVATDVAGFPAVGFHIRKEYQANFFDFTSKHSEEGGPGAGCRFAIILDGKILSAPMIRAGIRTGGVITAGAEGFSLLDQRNLISVLNSEPYPTDLKLVEERRNGRVVGVDEPGSPPGGTGWDGICKLGGEGMSLFKTGLEAVANATTEEEKKAGYLKMVKAHKKLEEAVQKTPGVIEGPGRRGLKEMEEIQANFMKWAETMAAIRKNLPMEYWAKLGK